jgi:hypothetical protein
MRTRYDFFGKSRISETNLSEGVGAASAQVEPLFRLQHRQQDGDRGCEGSNVQRSESQKTAMTSLIGSFIPTERTRLVATVTPKLNVSRQATIVLRRTEIRSSTQRPQIAPTSYDLAGASGTTTFDRPLFFRARKGSSTKRQLRSASIEQTAVVTMMMMRGCGQKYQIRRF